MKKEVILLLLLLFVVTSCNKNKKEIKSPFDLFSVENKLSLSNFGVDEDSLAQVEGVQCSDSLLVVIDYYSGNSFSLFDIKGGNCIRRFGAIGQGPEEIFLGAYGQLSNNEFYVSYDNLGVGLIGKYDLNFLRNNLKKPGLTVLTRYNIPEAFFSRVIPVDDSTYLGVGAYKKEHKYVLFDNKSEVIDSGVKVFGLEHEDFDFTHICLANQVRFKKHPKESLFVTTLNLSANIEFLAISNNKINLINSINLRDPKYNPISRNGLHSVNPDKDNIVGYIDVATSEQYVYALYSNKSITGKDDKGSPYASNVILVFDWSGQPVRKLLLPEDAYYIAVNENAGEIYAAVLNKEKGFSIVSYYLN